MLKVLSYTPDEGTTGTTLSVIFEYTINRDDAIHIRLVLQNTAVQTSVLEIKELGRWKAECKIPALRLSNGQQVPITLQALTADEIILDSVHFGQLSYYETDVDLRRRHSRRIQGGRERPSCYRRSSSGSTGGSLFTAPSLSLLGHSKAPPLRRMKQDTDQCERTDNVALQFITPLSDLSSNITQAEHLAGRRLVRFHKQYDRNRIVVFAEAIRQEQYDEQDIVVSCIIRPDTRDCVITSVDIIHLLQRLVDDTFEVDEKNRIRRNLEGLNPLTVTKTKPSLQTFFQRIMDFNDPRPRKIEKDLKVFDWKKLEAGLAKIMAKYSFDRHTNLMGLERRHAHDESPSPSSGSSTEVTPPFPQSTLPSGHCSVHPELSLSTLSLSPSATENSPYSPHSEFGSDYVGSELLQAETGYYVPNPAAPSVYSMSYESNPVTGGSGSIDSPLPEDWCSSIISLPDHSYGSGPAYDYHHHSDSQTSLDAYSAAYPLSTYDSFELSPGLVEVA
ncbi:hypothetical protein CONPUDRAFT_121730 [Coniophora puteana RWD-64-598 SS2]|uniref:DUF7082 domain-containing protein n=1 Tax=Coniophora puteana (strain RWD-64-598) TaxID=741705 RepID=A0A5M3MW05_CONPW|nr:uncharacterized protein CONPUDRAFT_121730 [Coniophora puteana RWD-64-598 SS2]EIW83240.1 hypothetical protein CONPUDRAFT_121730 [Coniophora puteana RWD-64-598 SS2]